MNLSYLKKLSVREATQKKIALKKRSNELIEMGLLIKGNFVQNNIFFFYK